MAKELPKQYMCQTCNFIQDKNFDVCPGCGVDKFGKQTRTKMYHLDGTELPINKKDKDWNPIVRR